MDTTETKLCLYDNPETHHRELWKDGEIVRSVESAVLLSVDFDPDVVSPLIGVSAYWRWQPGKIHYGTLGAMEE